MPAIVTTGFRAFSSKQNKEAFGEYGFDRLYVFIGRDTAWADEQLPPVPDETTVQMLEAHRDIIGLKKISAANMVNVARRIDWTYGNVYTQYDDLTSMTDAYEVQGDVFPEFYVMTDEYNVYKCIDNNGGIPSVIKPSGISLTTFETADGYLWKYMYTVTPGEVTNFLTNDWMPIKTLTANDGSNQWQVQEAAVEGSIETVIVQNGGTGYSAIDLPVITIDGDGTGATAVAEVDEVTGTITRIKITDPGSGYTYASVSISPNGSPGTGAAARAVMSPVGGHGADAISELGGHFLMVSVKLVDDESGKIPNNTTYRQIGLIANPTSTIAGKRIRYSNEVGIIKNGDTITGADSGATGTVIKSDYEDFYLDVDVTSGAFLLGETISVGTNTGVVSIIEDINLPLSGQAASSSEVVFGTGKMLYLENRSYVTRQPGQNELIKFVAEF